MRSIVQFYLLKTTIAPKKRLRRALPGPVAPWAETGVFDPAFPSDASTEGAELSRDGRYPSGYEV